MKDELYEDLKKKLENEYVLLSKTKEPQHYQDLKKKLEEDYVFLSKGRLWSFLGGAAVSLLLALGVSYATAKAVIESATTKATIAAIEANRDKSQSLVADIEKYRNQHKDIDGLYESVSGLKSDMAKKLDQDKMPAADYGVFAGESGCPPGFVEVESSLRAITVYDEGNSIGNYLRSGKFGKSSLSCHGQCTENGPRQRPNGVSNAAFIGDLHLAVCVRPPKSQ
jgi:hypothetical protein